MLRLHKRSKKDRLLNGQNCSRSDALLPDYFRQVQNVVHLGGTSAISGTECLNRIAQEVETDCVIWCVIDNKAFNLAKCQNLFWNMFGNPAWPSQLGQIGWWDNVQF
jgi:hypothetical protein